MAILWPRRQVAIAERSGLLTTVWYETLLAIFERVGGATGLANGKIWVGNSVNEPSAVTVSGDATLSSVGVLSVTENELAALKSVTAAADKLPYFTGASSAAVTDLTAFARTLLDDALASDARTTLGLGTIATQNANNVTITGGSITGITDLALADGGTGASTAADARTNLGLGTAAVKNTGTSGDAVPLLNGANTWAATQTFSVAPILPSYAVAGLPAVGTAGGMIFVTDETGGAVPAFSDGTNWRRVTDRAIVS